MHGIYLFDLMRCFSTPQDVYLFISRDGKMVMHSIKNKNDMQRK